MRAVKVAESDRRFDVARVGLDDALDPLGTVFAAFKVIKTKPDLYHRIAIQRRSLSHFFVCLDCLGALFATPENITEDQIDLRVSGVEIMSELQVAGCETGAFLGSDCGAEA